NIIQSHIFNTSDVPFQSERCMRDLISISENISLGSIMFILGMEGI
ncbi:MAG: hypothetical protein ACI94Y_002190, partial [Maribacter sp.]